MLVCLLLLLILLSSCPCILSWCRLFLLRWLLLINTRYHFPSIFNSDTRYIFSFFFVSLPCGQSRCCYCMYQVYVSRTGSTLRDYLHNHASTCHGEQRDACVCGYFYLCLRPLLLTTRYLSMSNYVITP